MEFSGAGGSVNRRNYVILSDRRGRPVQAREARREPVAFGACLGEFKGSALARQARCVGDHRRALRGSTAALNGSLASLTRRSPTFAVPLMTDLRTLRGRTVAWGNWLRNAARSAKRPRGSGSPPRSMRRRPCRIGQSWGRSWLAGRRPRRKRWFGRGY